MKKTINLCVCLCVWMFGHGQSALVFTNTHLNKLIEVKEGQTLSLKYEGYLGQTEYAKEVVTRITDSTLTLGFNPEMYGPLKNNEKLQNSHKVIRLSDIRQFRRMTMGRQIAKSLVVAGVVVGSYFLLYDLYRSESVSVGEGFLISLGIGIGTKLLVDAVFPEKPKYRMSEGWAITVIHE